MNEESISGHVMDKRPVIVAIAGPNGAGKTTFFQSHLREAGLHFINTDDIALQLVIPVYDAANIADALRIELLQQRESFVFETVFSDPIRAKLDFLRAAVATGYNVILCFIGISGPEVSEDRVAMRVSQGGHDVPSPKLVSRFPRTLANLQAAIEVLPVVLIFDNERLDFPFRKVAEFRTGKLVFAAEVLPQWLKALL